MNSEQNPTHTISPKWFKASEPKVLQKLQFMVMLKKKKVLLMKQIFLKHFT